jgi:putative oxidoreductase
MSPLARLIVAPNVGGRAAWAVAALRVAAGAVFVAFSFGKFVHHGAESAAFDRYGIPFPDAATALVGALELGGGLMLIAGLGTRLAALALAGDMIGAIATAGRIEGGPVHLGLAPALLAAMLVLLSTGAGRCSLDGRLAAAAPGRRRPAGRLALLGAAAAAAALALPLAGADAAGSASTIAVRDSAYGRILFDGNGRALYAFTRDPRGRSACAGACARAWPPFLVRGRPAAGTGVRAGLIGTARRADGRRQATYAGRPLYYYVGDDRPGVVRCQNVSEYGGLWLVQRASGALVR